MSRSIHAYLPGRFASIAGLVLFSVLAAGSLSATTLSGNFGTVGVGILTFQSGGAHFIDFCPTDPTSPPSSPSCVGAAGYGKGDITVTTANGFFTGTALTSGTILDLVDQPGHPPFTYFPVGVVVAVDNFLHLNALPTLNFQGNFFVPESCVATATQLCIGGFQLSQVANNVSLSATINGTVFDTASGATATFTDIMTAQFTNTTVGAVAAGATSSSGVFSDSWSNSVAVTPTSTPVPEPATLAMLGSGLGLLGAFVRRFRC